MLTPLDYPELRWAWTFSSEQCPEGMVGIQEQNLRIFSIEDISRNLLQESIPLPYTPRKFVKHPEHNLFYIIESDNNTLAPATRAKLINEAPTVNGEATVSNPDQFGNPHGNEHWASCIQIVDPVGSKSVVFSLDLEDNECATSIAIAPFAGQDDEAFLLVGTAKDLKVSPRSCSAGFLHVYRFHEEGRELEFIHKTKVDQPPTALLAFQGRLLAGIGSDLRIYDLGMKQMLRKCQTTPSPNIIVGLQTQGNRIIVSDSQESVSYCVYKFQDNKLIPFADDIIARWTTAAAMVDYETVAGGDKFGNLWLVRCPPKASEEADEDNSGSHLLHEKGYLNGAPNRLSPMTHFFANDIPMSLQKTNLVTGGRDLIFWTGFQGTLGILVPFVSREDVDFFQELEKQLATDHNPPLLGRDHLAYRSYYAPSKGTIDGDLCESYFLLPPDKKEIMAGQLDRSVREVERKISDMRTRVAY